MTPILALRGRNSSIILALLLFPLALVAGCDVQYHLRGIVLDAPDGPSTVSIVDADDPRLKDEGIRYATIELTVDPVSQKPDYMAPARTDGYGHFDIPITEFGTGLLTYDLQVVGRAAGHQPAIEIIKVPSSFKRVVIMLPPGKDTYKAQRDILDETLQMQKDLDQ